MIIPISKGRPKPGACKLVIVTYIRDEGDHIRNIERTYL